MGLFNSKHQEDENCLRIEDLPVEIMVEIISYLDKTDKIHVFSMVNRRWFDIANNEIEALCIKWPQEKSQFNFWKFWKFCKSFWKFDSVQLLNENQDFLNLIGRFERLKNLELATKITNKNMIKPVDSFEFDGTLGLEFEICPDLIPTKNPPIPPFNEIDDDTDLGGAQFTVSRRIKINPAKEKDFDLEYDRNQIISFEICMDIPYQDDKIDSIVEEIRSLDNVSEILYRCDSIGCVKVLRSILSRPYLKQINFHFIEFRFDTEEEFPINCNVEEIELDLYSLKSFKLWNKLFDALPNIKKVKIIVVLLDDEFENLPDYIKTISKLKHLKSLNVAISSRWHDKFDAEKFEHFPEIRDCFEIIRNNFPMKSEVVIADFPEDDADDLTNLIEKEEGKNPKIVNGLSQS